MYSCIIAAEGIKVYYYIFLIPVGVVGNILSFLVKYNLLHNDVLTTFSDI